MATATAAGSAEQGEPHASFDTPEPITAIVDVVVGDVRIRAGERDTTVVDVRPSDASSKDDLRVAEQTRVDWASDHLLVKTPKLRSWSLRSTGGSVDVTVELPAGSDLRGTGQATDFRADGRLGEARIKTGLGSITLAEAATLNLKNGIGDIGVEHVTGDAEVTTGSGDVRLGALDRSAVVKNSNGDTWIGTARGDLRVSAANGDIAVEVAEASVVAKSSNGDVRLGDVVRGSVVLETAARRPRGRHPRGHRRLARCPRDRRPGAQRARGRRGARPLGRHRRGARPHIRRQRRDPEAVMIALKGLRKSFGDHLVLDGIDLDVAEGTVFALLGPNGAGKTTMVQILSTLISADAGELTVAGHDIATDPDGVRAAIGVTGQFSAVDNLLTGRENLILMADLHHLGRAEGRRRAAELLDRFDLADAADRPAATYSGGMRAGSTWR